MKNRLVKSALLLCVLGIASLALAQSEKVTIKGYLMDKMCSAQILKSKDAQADARRHTRECAEECAGSGFGVIAGDKYYLFDQKGNELAKSMLKTTKKADSLSVEVTGTLQDNTIKVESLKEVD